MAAYCLLVNYVLEKKITYGYKRLDVIKLDNALKDEPMENKEL